MMLLPAQRRAILEADHPSWAPRTLSQALDHATARFGDAPLVMTDEGVWSYRDIQAASLALAGRLLDDGVAPGDHVGIYLANYVEFVIAKFAIARIGAVAIPINFLLRRHELSYVLAQSECVSLITMDRFRDFDYLAMLDGMMPGWESGAGGVQFPRLRHVYVHSCGGGGRDNALLLRDAIAQRPTDAMLRRLNGIAGDPHFRCDIIYTSGTTGRSKGAMLTHDMVLRTAYASAYTRAFESGRRILFALPLYHVFGYVECLMAALFVGGAIIPRLVFDAEDTLRSAEKFAANEMVCVPLMTEKLLELIPRRGFDHSHLIAMFNSGGHTASTIWRDIREIMGAPEVLTGFGMTETTASTCCTLPEGEDDHLITSNGRLKDAGVAGFAEFGGRQAAYKVIDSATGADLPFGSEGELLVRGPIVTSGYYNQPEETATAFTPDGWLRTGDIGTIDAEGYVSFKGRIKEAYRCGGEMVMPIEVEDVLKEHPAVEHAYLVGVPDARMGEVGCAFIVAADIPAEPRELAAFCAERLARFKVPKYFLHVGADAIPHTVTGRPQRVALRATARQKLGI